jgi:hypothetical protein
LSATSIDTVYVLAQHCCQQTGQKRPFIRTIMSTDNSSGVLSADELTKLAEKAAKKAAKAVEDQGFIAKQRPDFSIPEYELPSGKETKAMKGLLPGGVRGSEAEKSFYINRFPRDFDKKDFSMARYCAAVERSMHTIEGTQAFGKWAPKEHAYYEALASYGRESKAMNEMTSGTDGGFLAPERFLEAA